MDKCSLPEGEVSNTVEKLRNDLSGKLQINHGKKIMDSIDKEEGEDDDDEDDPDFSEEELLAQMGYAVSKPESSTYTEEVEADYQGTLDCSNHTPISMPVSDLKLVSALKGSRGKLNKECRVSWAPDVYNPPPSAERFFQNGPDVKVVVKVNTAKNKQKSGGRGASTSQGRGKVGKAGKDKKQGKKNGGRGCKNPNYSEF